MNKIDGKSKKFMIFGIIILAITVVGSTLAYYIWSSSEQIKISTTFGGAYVYFDGGSAIENATLRPVADKSKGITKNISMRADATGVTANVYLDLVTLPDGLKDVSFRYAIYNGSTLAKEGNFSSTSLSSSTSTCTTNSTTHITLLSNVSVPITKTTYTLYIWIDGANYTNPKSMMNQTFSFKLHADGEGAVLKGPTAAETITKVYMNAAKETVTNNSIIYNTAPSVSLMNDKLGGTTEDLNGGNIRYYGANPNNYIYFNCSDYKNQSSSTCETWRIIGVFDGKVKIMRGSSIGTYSWDNKDTSTGAEDAYGKNDWTTARLMKLLNPSNYYTIDSNDNGNGQSLYWNAKTGTCFSGLNNATKSCNFTSTGLKNDTTRNMIAEVTYNLGGWNTASIYPNQIYGYERGTTVFSGRPTTWIGKIALAYPSDYGYAAGLSLCQKQLGSYNDATCTSNNWMKTIITNSGSNRGWLLTPASDSAAYAWHVDSSGYFRSHDACNTRWVVPVLHLNSGLEISGGTGASSAPYQLNV